LAISPSRGDTLSRRNDAGTAKILLERDGFHGAGAHASAAIHTSIVHFSLTFHHRDGLHRTGTYTSLATHTGIFIYHCSHNPYLLKKSLVFTSGEQNITNVGVSAMKHALFYFFGKKSAPENLFGILFGKDFP
jgi:hypothetical protein